MAHHGCLRRRAQVMLYVVMGALASACARSDDTEAALMQSGLDALYARKDPDTSINQFTRVLVNNPSHYGATFQLAMALDQAGKPDEARPVWKRVLAMAEASHDTDAANTARMRLARPGPPSQEELMNSGLAALYARGDGVKAISEFKRVLEINPTHYGATFQLARALDRAGNGKEASLIWKTVLEMAENCGDIETASAARARLQ